MQTWIICSQEGRSIIAVRKRGLTRALLGVRRQREAAALWMSFNRQSPIGNRQLPITRRTWRFLAVLQFPVTERVPVETS